MLGGGIRPWPSGAEGEGSAADIRERPFDIREHPLDIPDVLIVMFFCPILVDVPPTRVHVAMVTFFWPCFHGTTKKALLGHLKKI